MSLVWQKQLLLEDYRGVCRPEGKRGKYTDRMIRPHRVGGKKIRGTFLFVNQWIWWQGLLGNLCREFLNGINIPMLSLSSPFPSPPPRGSQDREANQFVSVDGAKAAINKVSVLFTFCSENHLGDRQVLFFLSLKGYMQIPAKQQLNNMQFLWRWQIWYDN